MKRRAALARLAGAAAATAGRTTRLASAVAAMAVGGRVAGRATRLAFGVAAVAFGLALVTACGSSSPTLASSHARGRLERAVLTTMDEHGLPVDIDHIQCGLTPTGPVLCYGVTADEPTEPVTGTFVTHSKAPGRCPGTLHVTVGGSSLPPTREDPCR